MSHFNGEQVFYSDQNFRVHDDPFTQEETAADSLKRAMRFIREFNALDEFKYRDQLKNNVADGLNILRVEIQDINNFDNILYNNILEHPGQIQPLFEKQIKESYASDHQILPSEAPDFQLQLISQQKPSKLSELTPNQIGKLVTIKCIVISSKSIRVKAKIATAVCRECNDVQRFDLGYGPTPINLPRICLGKNQQKGQMNAQCPTDPYVLIPEKCTFIDQQILRIQELPDQIETGEIPRNFSIYCDRYLVGNLTSGSRAIITGIYLVPNKNQQFKSNAGEQELQVPFIHVMGLQSARTSQSLAIPEHEIQRFKEAAASGDIYKILCNSIAPQIFGHREIKLALACLLFSGSAKWLPDGMKLRGDINVLLIGDPSTAKSQILKFIERAADISVYTSGKGSSAAGLTASITFQNNTAQFTLEAGALVLASGGVCCIDEFDKMRAEDRVAMHEAMEQQTISIAKAGITTRLNARCSILAAANPIFGRYQESKSIQDQIELQTTILSRFDTIFIVKDIRTEENDQRMATHIVNLHADQNKEENPVEAARDQFDLEKLKRYVRYAKKNISPRLSDQAAQMISNLYVDDRQKSRDQSQGHGKSHIPITVRQLEAIIRLSESLAKMELKDIVSENHVKEAHRLFQNSTMAAVSLGAKEFGLELTAELRQIVEKIEDSILRRVHIGSKIPLEKLVTELTDKFSNKKAVEFAINKLIQSEVLQQLEFKNMLQRKK